MNPIAAIGEVAAATGKIVDLVQTRERRENEPEMKTNAEARTDAEIKDEAAAAISEKNLEELRKLNS